MFYIGLDLGQRQDHSAIAVVELCGGGMLGVRRVERVPLGTTYPRVVERVRTIVQHPYVAGQCRLAVDGTGLGAPVVDLLRAARLGCEVCAVTITGGDQGHQRGAGWSVPKRDLLAGLQVLLERGELRIAGRQRDTGALVRELLDMQAAVKPNGRLRLGADGAGQHDDLAIALALACWLAGQRRNGFGSVRLPGI
ncbi:MAG: hypothetical protein JWO80_6481 [Bryobacterales bacterium]|nr:hypothetical protein [Bryobacterales bacterium]